MYCDTQIAKCKCNCIQLHYLYCIMSPRDYWTVVINMFLVAS